MSENDHAPRLLKIGAFAERAGTNLRTLRYYEEIGLLRPASRSKGGFRYYRETDVHRLAMVQKLQDLGLPLERIGELLHTETDGDEFGRQQFVGQVAAILHEQERLLEERASAIEVQRASIAQALAKLGECGVCEHRPSQSNNHCEPCPMDGAPLPPDLSALFQS